jgi:hypothetical protein
MGLKRFQFLMSHLRLDNIVDREEGKLHDKFQPAREIFELFNEACTEALQCGDQLCVDESLYRNFGRGFSFKQYMKAKPAKYGLLYRSLNDSKLPFTYRSIVYAGRPAEEPTENYMVGVEETVVELLRRYGAKNELKGRNLTTDRFYTSVDLADTLLTEFNMTCLGTLTANRKGLPGEFKSLVGRQEGDYLVLFEESGKMSLHSWVVNTKSAGKKNIMLLTTTNPILGKTMDDGKDRPAIIAFYNYAMLGTDRMDQLGQNFTTRVKSKRWTMSVLSYILDTCRVNARTIGSLKEVSKTTYFVSFFFVLLEEIFVH